MKQTILQKYGWLAVLAAFDFLYYYLIQVMSMSHNGASQIEIMWEGVIFIFLISLFSLGCVRVVKKQQDRKVTQAISLKYLKILLYSFLLFILISASFQFVIEYLAGQRRSLEYVLGNAILYVFLHIIVGNAYIALAYFRESARLRQDLLLSEKAKTESELKMLQQQMDPHFLFNNLNTLASLISQDTEKAISFTRDLSGILRYISQNTHKDITTLEEEMTFLSSYMELMHARIGQAYRLITDLGSVDTRQSLIIPMTLQLLIENVIKHNSGSRSQPLNIELSAEAGYISVRNAIQKKRITQDQESGLGLQNLQERYRLTTGRSISYGESDGYFEVKIPIINRIEDESLTH